MRACVRACVRVCAFISYLTITIGQVVQVRGRPSAPTYGSGKNYVTIRSSFFANFARTSYEVRPKWDGSSYEVCLKFERSCPEGRSKLSRSSFEVALKFVRSCIEVRSKLH